MYTCSYISFNNDIIIMSLIKNIHIHNIYTQSNDNTYTITLNRSGQVKII